MTQEEKQLLLKDLSARLSYGVICRYENDGHVSKDLELIDISKVETNTGYIYWDCYFENDDYQDIPIEIVRPHLRSMSSMTEEENEERKKLGILTAIDDNHKRIFDGFGNISAEDAIKAIDWLNSHFIDYRGLIGLGLALEAPEGLYKTE